MKILRRFSIIVSFLFIFNTLAYGNDFAIEMSNIEREYEKFEVLDLQIEGMVEVFDEQLQAPVFTSTTNDMQTLIFDVEDNIYNIVDSFVKVEEDELYTVKKSAISSAATTDLVAHGLISEGELLPGRDATFSYVLSNDGPTNLTNVQYEIRINNQSIGIVTISSTIMANTQYRVGFILEGLSEGSYYITVNVDPNNRIPESNKANNITSANFIVQNGIPDLTVRITSPTSSTLPGVDIGDASQKFKFRLDNIGTGYAPENVYVEVQADDSAIYGFYLDQPMAPNKGADGEFNLLFATYKPTEIKIIIDPYNRIVESNKNNNSHARIYSPDFCLHKFQPNTRITGDIGVQIVDTAIFGNVDVNLYQNNLGAWNGITDDLEVTTAYVTNTESLMPGYNVLIRGAISPGNESQVMGETKIITSGTPHARIELFTDNMINRSVAANTRTLVHELGHAFNLHHPNESGPSCSYSSIMYQSRYSNTDYITLHDQYGIYQLHDKSATSYSAEPLYNDDMNTEYVIHTQFEMDINSIEELEDISDYIVKGIILDNGENVLTKYSHYTKTGFEITEVYKGDLEIGETIYIGEDYYSEIIDGKDITFYYNNYTESIPGEEYIFFLIKKPDFDVYGLSYSTLSRYNLNHSTPMKANAIEEERNDSFTEGNYNSIQRDVLLSY